MKLYLIAWRNLWRNKKRTIITVAAILFAVFLSTFMSSMQEGTYSRMIENTVSFYSGYIQVHDSNYWENKSINEAYVPTEEFIQQIESNPNVTMSFPRIESFTLLSSGENTKASALIGIDPVKEDEITNLSKWVTKGVYLRPNDDGVLLASNLARQLKVEIGDTIVLISVGYHGASAAQLAILKGIVHFPSPKMNSFAAYVTLKKAQAFYSTENMITSTVVMIDNYKHLERTQRQLERSIGNTYHVKSWKEIQPEIVQMIEQDRAGGLIMKIIVYTVIGFGILGTIIMMMAERKKELAIMLAVGMQKKKLIKIMFYETLFIGLIGVVLGFMFSAPIMTYFLHHPINLPDNVAEVYEKFGFEAKLFFSMYYPVFVNQLITIFVITMVVFVYPLITIVNFKLIQTLRS